MKTNEIKLIFKDKTVPSLAGYDYGLSIYKEQVQNKIDFDSKEIVIIFPDDKSIIASSFIEGFFDGIKEKLGVTELLMKIKVCSVHQNVVNKIYEALR